MKFAYAMGFSSRIATRCLRWLLQDGHEPVCVIVDDDLGHPVMGLKTFVGLTDKAHRYLSLDHEVDYIFAVHFHPKVPPRWLRVPRHGWLNLHPGYLPWGRGWHAPSYAILNREPAGATVHYMDEGIDTGPVVYQKQVPILPIDTADTLTQRVMHAEYLTFIGAFTMARNAAPHPVASTPQPQGDAFPTRKREDLTTSLDGLEAEYFLDINQLRARTTNNYREAITTTIDGQRVAVQVILREIP